MYMVQTSLQIQKLSTKIWYIIAYTVTKRLGYSAKLHCNKETHYSLKVKKYLHSNRTQL